MPFSLTINYDSKEYHLKAVKTAYSNQEIIYKLALPTIISLTNQCWISRNGLNWKVVMGLSIEASLVRALIAGIQTYEQTGAIIKQAPKLKLKRLSA